MESYSGKETNLRDYLRIFFRHKAIIITTIIVVMSIIFIRQSLSTPVYIGQVKMLIAARMETEADYYKGVGGGWSSYSQGELVRSRPVIERVVKALKLYERPLDYEKNFSSRLKAALIDYRSKKAMLDFEEMTPEQRRESLFGWTVQQLTQRVSVNPIPETSLFTINVRDFSPDGAAILANVVSRSYIILDLERQIAELQLKYGERNSTVIQLKNYIDKLQETLDGKPLPDIEAIGPASVKIVEQAQVHAVPMKGNITFIVGFFVSIFLGVFLAIVFESLDQSFKSPQDVERFLAIPLLGAIPNRKSKDKLLINSANPVTTNYTRSYQNLSDQIYLLMKDKNLKTISITDAEASEETPAVIANLGIYLSQNAGHKVLIIDTDLRNPSVSKVFDIADNVGLTDVLENKVPLEDAVQDLGSGLYILPAGETTFNPITLLDSSAMLEVIKTVKEQYDMVFLVCADLKNFKDAVTLASITDAIALVVNEGKVRRQIVIGAIAPLKQKKANIIGVILNNRTYVIPGIIYKYT